MQMSCATDVDDFMRFIDKSSIDAKDNIGKGELLLLLLLLRYDDEGDWNAWDCGSLVILPATFFAW